MLRAFTGDERDLFPPHSILTLVATVYSVSVYFLVHYPYPNILGVLVTVVVKLFRISQKKMLFLREENRRIRDLVCVRVRSRGDKKISEMYLRDDILKIIKSFIEKVWPRVFK